MMTDAVTRYLPDSWQGRYDPARAEAWIAARESEGPLLVVTERATDEVVGLLLLFESANDDATAIGIRLGYLLAEAAWGRGLATELVGGLVDWCRRRPTIHTLIGGVADNNQASIRALASNGFQPTRDKVRKTDDHMMFVLDLHT